MQLKVKWLSCEAVQLQEMSRCLRRTCCIHLQNRRLLDQTVQCPLPADQILRSLYLWDIALCYLVLCCNTMQGAHLQVLDVL
jgi:hypothetical protein